MEESKNEIVNNKNKFENKRQKRKIERKKIDKLIKEYVATFDEKDQIAYKIAQEHLKSSFRLEKSIGFNKWLKNRK
jgi:hypothetical protein